MDANKSQPKSRDDWRPSGIVVALVTPFRDDESIDEERIASHVDYLIESGVAGVMPIGGSGEYVNLTPAERERVVDVTIAAVAGRVPVTVGALAPSTREALAIGEYAAGAGADALLVLPPYYIAPSAAGVIDHFATIADRTGLPVIVYNNPPRTARAIDVALLSELADLPAAIAVKEGDRDFGSISAKIQAIRGRMAYLCGDDDLVLPSLASGADGAIMATPNMAPKLCLALFEAFKANDNARALELNETLVRLTHVRKIPNHPGPLKEWMGMLGMPVGLGRRPLMPMTASEREAVAALSDELRASIN
jgi:4-hydroxy-tetrahydrodipicolinate synthase